MLKISRLPLLILVIAVIGGSLFWRNALSEVSDDALVLYGNVDLRQISLAFTSVERVLRMHVEEGDQVREGQVLAELDTTLLTLRIAQAQAQVRVQEEALARLQAGSRPQEIAQARAQRDVAQMDATLAVQQLTRLQGIRTESAGRAVSEADLEAAEARAGIAQAALQRAQESLSLVEAGPAAEDIARAEAQRDAVRAELAVLEQQRRDAQLIAPVDAIVRSRLLEPGELASPQRPAYTLAIVAPKWVRAYIDEVSLGRVRIGQDVQVTTDSHPAPLQGTVSYLASVAEFTPKSVQTEDLRTSLVYEIRMRVEDPDNRLRLGMPATVRIALDRTGNVE